MATSPSHRSPASVSPVGLATPPHKQQRRMTSPSLPPPSSLNLPEPVYGHPQPRRPPSPLRNSFTRDDEDDGSDDDSHDINEDDEEGTWGHRSRSPASSVSHLAATFAQRVGSFMSPRTGLPTDAELEAEAGRERDRSRREAERILTREAEERRLVEERVLAMMQASRGGSPKSLPLPVRAQTLPNPPSPATSQKEGSAGSTGSWWAAAKNKLTPTKDKDPLTPAQQIVQDAKAKEKTDKKNKSKEKEKGISKEWPASAQEKYRDPAFLNLAIPANSIPRKPVPTSPSSPTPARPAALNSAVAMTPSPLRSNDEGLSPLREAPPLYAQFNLQGTLDVHGTLLTIAKRFEKLEKWTVSHVRALEERMGDVERWLVDKEKEKEEQEERASLSTTSVGGHTASDNDVARNELSDIREELTELQGRVGELGREMAKVATAPSNLSSGPSREPASISTAPPTTSSIAVQPHTSPFNEHATIIATTPRAPSETARDSTSPPLSASQASSARTRLPYPTGDYATPPDSVHLAQSFFSPTGSPESSITSATRISGLPAVSPPASAGSSGLPRMTSPSPAGLPPPKSSHPPRTSSISPTPRKRYTVALGGPIMAAAERTADRPRSPSSFARPHLAVGTAYFSGSDVDVESPAEDSEDSEEMIFQDAQDHTIGKSAGRWFGVQNDSIATTPAHVSASPATSPQPSPNARIRPMSLYGGGPALSSATYVAPLRPRVRSRSTVGLGIKDVALGDSGGIVHGPVPITPLAGKFVDPLLLRRQESKDVGTGLAKEVKVSAGKKVPVGQLVAFFDGDKHLNE